MARHVFDLRHSATHQLLAEQLRALADQLAAGELDLAYEDWHTPTEVVDPVNVVVDLKQGRRQVDLVIHLSWPVAEGPASG